MLGGFDWGFWRWMWVGCNGFLNRWSCMKMYTLTRIFLTMLTRPGPKAQRSLASRAIRWGSRWTMTTTRGRSWKVPGRRLGPAGLDPTRAATSWHWVLVNDWWMLHKLPGPGSDTTRLIAGLIGRSAWERRAMWRSWNGMLNKWVGSGLWSWDLWWLHGRSWFGSGRFGFWTINGQLLIIALLISCLRPSWIRFNISEQSMSRWRWSSWRWMFHRSWLWR